MRSIILRGSSIAIQASLSHPVSAGSELNSVTLTAEQELITIINSVAF